jgi:hypothetical protein
MKNTDIESFYKRINKDINLITAITKIPNLSKIIKACRLKPYSIFDKNIEVKYGREYHWVDEFGHSLKLDGGKPQIILYDDNIIQECSQTLTDLFFGNPIKEAIKDSKSLLIAHGDMASLIALYCNDGYLRCYKILGLGRYIRVSPLLLGIKTLNTFIKNVMGEIDVKELDCLVPFKMDRCIITSLPIKQGIPSCFDYVIGEIIG